MLKVAVCGCVWIYNYLKKAIIEKMLGASVGRRRHWKAFQAGTSATGFMTLSWEYVRQRSCV